MRWWVKNKQRGFTLVELLIVIVVIAILAALIIVAYNGLQGRAAEASVRSDLRNIFNKMEIYNTDKGHYPSDATELNSFRVGGVARDTYHASSGNLIYCTSAEGGSFAVAAKLKNSKILAVGSDGLISEVTIASWDSGGTVVCPVLGVTLSHWNWGYQPAGWGQPGWRAWTGR